MANQLQELEALHDIRNMMERSSRFISLSGWSGVAAGMAALLGAYEAKRKIDAYYLDQVSGKNCPGCLLQDLVSIAAVVFVVALAGAFFFTFVKARKQGVSIWGHSSKRLLWNTLLPMAIGGLVILKMVDLKYYDLVPAVSLLFYGLALVNGSKYTLGEVRYLGYAILATGLAGMWFDRTGLYSWAFGFGILHIIYGITMWWKYERREEA